MLIKMVAGRSILLYVHSVQTPKYHSLIDISQKTTIHMNLNIGIVRLPLTI